MSNKDELKEIIGFLRLFFGFMLVTDSGLSIWTYQSIIANNTFDSMVAIGGLIVATYITMEIIRISLYYMRKLRNCR